MKNRKIRTSGFIVLLILLLAFPLGVVFGQEQAPPAPAGDTITSDAAANPDTPIDNSSIPNQNQTVQAGQEEQPPTSKELEDAKKKGAPTATLASPTDSGPGPEPEPAQDITDEASFGTATLPGNSLFTGAAVYNIPIKVLPGRNRLSPKLSLTYNSFKTNSWLGPGWDLQPGLIQRATRHGLDYNQNDYVLVTDEIDRDLAPRPAWGVNYYGERIEENFSKYYLNPASGGWEVTLKDGTKYYYGSTTATRLGPDANHVFQWLLDKIQDTNGNYITISYTLDQGQAYPILIRYTGHVPDLGPANSLKFILEDRPDPITDYQSQTKTVLAKRLKAIEMYNKDNQLSGSYRLTYQAGQTTRLVRVDQYGSDNQTPLPALELSYPAEGQLAFNDPQTFYTSGTTEPGYLKMADINSDGKADLITYNALGDVFVALSNGDANFQPAIQVISQGPGAQGQGYLLVADINKDGKADLIAYDPNGTIYVYFSNGDGTFKEPIIYSGPGGNGPALVQLADVNADGFPDLVKSSLEGNAIYIYLNQKDGTFSGYQQHTAPGGGKGLFALADVNGDGCADLIKFNNNAVTVYLADHQGNFQNAGSTLDNIQGNGRGYWTMADVDGNAKADLITYDPNANIYIYLSRGDGTFENTPITHQSIGGDGPGRVHLVDLRKSGKPDLIKLDKDGNIYIYQNQGNNRFATTPLALAGITGSADYGILFPDLTGKSVHDIVKPGPNNQCYAYLSKSNGGPANLLSSIQVQNGSRIELSYGPSTSCSETNLPMTLNLVSSITTNDGLGNLAVKKYTYSNGLYDQSDREFRGFAQVAQTNPDNTQKVTWFHQDYYLKGKPIKSQLLAGNGTLLSRTTYTWDKTWLDGPQNQSAFVKLGSKRTEFYDAVTVFSQEDHTYDDANGNLLTSTSSGTDAESLTLTYQYQNLGDWVWRQTQSTLTGNVIGKVRENYAGYEPNTGNLLTKSAWLNGSSNPVITLTYDAYGNVKTVTDARNNTTGIDYDPLTHTFPIKVTGPATGSITHVTQTGYNYLYGKPAATTDENNNTTTYTYDLFGRISRIDYPDGGQTIYQYFDNIFPRYVVTRVKEDSAGHYIEKYAYYDGLGRLIQTSALGENDQAIVVQVHYDNMGRKDLVQGPFFASNLNFGVEPPPTGYSWTRISYDDRSRPVKIESPHGDYPGESITTIMAYSGFSITTTDPDNARKTEHKDYLGRIIEVIEYNDPEQYHTFYQYNAAADLLKVTDALANQTILTYDTLGRKISMQDPDMGLWTYAYDPKGNLLKQTDAKGQETQFAYDELDRVLNKTYYRNGLPSPIDGPVVYTYDNLTIPFGRGRPFSVTKAEPKDVERKHDPHHHHHHAEPIVDRINAYDPLGRVLNSTKIIDHREYTTQTQYDLSGKQIQLTYPDGHKVTNTYYPGTGLLQSVSSGKNTYSLFSDYEPTGKIGQIDYANATATKYTYDPWSSKIFGIVTTKPDRKHAHDLQNKTYHYTRAGDIDQIRDHLKDRTYTYTYDQLHRLLSEKTTSDSKEKYHHPPYPQEIVYAYDALGRLKSKQTSRGDGKTEMSLELSYMDGAHVHAVSQVKINQGRAWEFKYDPNGNMKIGPDLTRLPERLERDHHADWDSGRDFDEFRHNRHDDDNGPHGPFRLVTYDADNMPISIRTRETTVFFTYDGSGNRVKKEVKGEPATLYIGEHYEIRDHAVTKYIFGGNLRLAMIQGRRTFYYHKDHLGSTAAVTDHEGRSVETADYQPFGSMREHQGWNTSAYLFTDQELDNETNLYNYDARLYDPVLGMFVTPDSIVPRPYDPQSLNRYAYCRNNPLIYTDPTGHYDVEGNDTREADAQHGRECKEAAEKNARDVAARENGGCGPMPSDGWAGEDCTPKEGPKPGEPGYQPPGSSTQPTTEETPTFSPEEEPTFWDTLKWDIYKAVDFLTGGPRRREADKRRGTVVGEPRG